MSAGESYRINKSLTSNVIVGKAGRTYFPANEAEFLARIVHFHGAGHVLGRAIAHLQSGQPAPFSHWLSIPTIFF